MYGKEARQAAYHEPFGCLREGRATTATAFYAAWNLPDGQKWRDRPGSWMSRSHRCDPLRDGGVVGLEERHDGPFLPLEIGDDRWWQRILWAVAEGLAIHAQLDTITTHARQ